MLRKITLRQVLVILIILTLIKLAARFIYNS